MTTHSGIAEVGIVSYKTPPWYGERPTGITMDRHKLALGRGLVAGLSAAAIAATGPWLLLHLLLLVNRLGTDLDPSPDGARVGSYLFASIVGAAAFVSFGTRPRGQVWRDFVRVAFVALIIVAVLHVVDGPRMKGDPPFGEKPTDIVLFTIPSVVTGIALLAWRTLRGSRFASMTATELSRTQP
jgi:hypothetical protein